MAAKDKVIRSLSQVLLLRDHATTPAATTVGAAGAAAGQKVVPVATTTSYAVGDPVRIGSGEMLEVGVVASIQAGISLTLADNLTFSHVAGEVVSRQQAYDLGDIVEGGVELPMSASILDVGVATKRIPFTNLEGYVNAGMSFALPTVTLDAICVALGIPFSKQSGANTTSSPLSLVTDGSEFATEQNQSLMALGVTNDGTTVRVELWGVDFDYTGLQLSLSRGVLSSVPVKAGAASGGVITTNASAYTVTTTKRPTKGKVFDALQEVGVMSDATTGPLATTLAAAAAAGANSVSLAASTNLVAGDFLRIGTADQAEYLRVDSISGAGPYTVNLRTPLYRAHASGDVAVRQVLTPVSGVAQDGVKFEAGGGVTEVKSGTNRFMLGLKPGLAIMALSFGLIDFSLANWALALGIPAAQIANGRLPLASASFATAQLNCVYAKGLLQDGSTAWVLAWGTSQDVSQFTTKLANTDVGMLPLKVKPSSALQFMQHP